MTQSAPILEPTSEIEGLSFRDRFVTSLPGDPKLENSCRQVFGACYSRVEPTAVPAPKLLALVPEVAELLDLRLTESPALVEVLAGNRIVTGMAPYSACYGGHQFGTWAGQLGDGRAITLGEVQNQRGESWEIQLKGAGRTPYSRRADGRAVLRSSLRELVCSEAMHHLGIPTTRALSLVLTGESVERDLFYDGNPKLEPGAIVCRVAPSFLRFGSYEIHAAREDEASLRRLVHFTLQTQFPSFVNGDQLDVAAFFAEVGRRTIALVIDWMRVGFVHGVMNTDNMSILGLSLDYGPYGWLDTFDPDFTPNTTDAAGGRYRFGNQPRIAYWNLSQLAQALAVLLDDVAPLERALAACRDQFATGQRRMQLGKLGLTPRPETTSEDDTLLAELSTLLGALETDMTLFFRKLAELPSQEKPFSAGHAFSILRDAYYAPDRAASESLARIASWLERYLERARREGVSDKERRLRMHAVNPLYIARNYLVQQVIEKSEGGERAALAEMLAVLRRPYQEQPGREAYAAKRPEWARRRAGCSMLSCSS